MPNLAGRNTLDTTNTDGNCIYDAKALGGNPTRSPNVRIAGSLLETYDSTSILDNVTPRKVIFFFQRIGEVKKTINWR